MQEILNNEEEENNSAIAVEVSEEVTDTQAAVVAPPESSPTTAMQQGTPSLNRLALAAAQSSLTNQRILQTAFDMEPHARSKGSSLPKLTLEWVTCWK